MKSHLRIALSIAALSFGVLAGSCGERDNYDAEWSTWCPDPGNPGNPELRTCGEICEHAGVSCGLTDECDGVAYGLDFSLCDLGGHEDGVPFDVGCDGLLPEGYYGYACCCSLWVGPDR